MRYALRNIVRLPSRSIILFILSCVLLFSSMFGIFVISVCKESLSRTFGPLNGTAIVTDKEGYPFISYNVARDICASSSSIKGLWAEKSYEAILKDIKYTGEGDFKKQYAVYGEPEEKEEGFMLVACTDMSCCDEFFGGRAELVSGSLISDSDNENSYLKIVISDKLAELNGLSLGDDITLNMYSMFSDFDTSVYYSSQPAFADWFRTYTIGGIYKNISSSSYTASSAYLLDDNRVYIPISTITDYTENELSYNYYLISSPLSAKFDNPVLIPDSTYLFLNDIGDIGKAEDAINKIGFAKDIKLTEFVSDASSSPAARLSKIMYIMIALTVVAGFSILALIILFYMNSRKREFAVLSALGKKRVKTALSFFAEISVIIMVSVIICALAFALCSYLTAEPISVYLNASESSVKTQNSDSDMYISSTLHEDEAVRKITDFSYLLSAFILPAFSSAVIVTLLLEIILFIFIYAYIKRIDILAAAGGKQ